MSTSEQNFFLMSYTTVGYYDPEGKWHSESDHSVKEDAINRVAFLNGGTKQNTKKEEMKDELKTKRNLMLTAAAPDLLKACVTALHVIKNIAECEELEYEIIMAVKKATGKDYYKDKLNM